MLLQSLFKTYNKDLCLPLLVDEVHMKVIYISQRNIRYFDSLVEVELDAQTSTFEQSK